MFLVLEQPATHVAKVSTVTRCIAKSVDLCVIIFLSVVLPYPVGVMLGFIYTLTHDGVRNGQSIGNGFFSSER